MRSALVLSVAVLCCGCASHERSPAPGSDGAVAIDPATPAGRIVLELWQLRPGITLAEWNGAHPEEPIIGRDTSTLATQSLGNWCAYAARRSTADSGAMIRATYFYPPPPPPDLALPDTGSLDLLRHCVIGLVWTGTDVKDSVAGASLADSVRAQLQRAVGRPVSGTVSFWGSAWWSHVGRFRKDSIVVVAALRQRTAPAGTDVGTDRANVVAFAFAPVAGVSVDSAEGRREDTWQPDDTLPLDSVARVATPDTALWSRLRRVTAAAGSANARKLPPDSLIVPLSRWLAATAGLPNPRRAAALFVADRVLERAMCSYSLCDDPAAPALARLRSLGAKIGWAQLGGTNVYERTWVSQARNLDRDSPLGQRILLAQLNAAFDFSGTCAAGADGFRRVIDNGERYLERVPDSPVAAAVHYLTAEAYGDILALAHGAGSEWADSSRYTAEAPEAARKAIAHYADAIRLGNKGAVARAAWRRVWWLRAGLTPRDVRFYCVYD